jgi:hypothetical protein
MNAARWSHTVTIIAACGGLDAAAPAPPSSEGSQMTSDYRITDEPILAIPLRPIRRSLESKPVPAVFDESQALGMQAHQAYRAHDHARAAEGFVRAALVLRVPAGEYAEAASRNRAALFSNAAYAWRSAGTPDVGREVLTRLLMEKRATADDLRKALEVLQ